MFSGPKPREEAPDRGALREMTLSRVCSLDDWRVPEMVALMDEIVPGGQAAARAHRKSWEFALGVLTLERGGALGEDSLGLSVGAGHEAIVYYLTNRCRWLVATDLYGSGDFADGESSGRMLIDPDLFAPYAYERRRLTVAYMDALDLRVPDGTFDYVVSFGSIEHFGGIPAAATALAEVGRVLKPDGVACITTELAADGLGDGVDPSFHLFAPETIAGLVDDEPTLAWLGEVDLSMPDDDCPLVSLRDEVRTGASDQLYPQVKLQTVTVEGRPRDFRSVSLALRRAS